MLSINHLEGNRRENTIEAHFLHARHIHGRIPIAARIDRSGIVCCYCHNVTGTTDGVHWPCGLETLVILVDIIPDYLCITRVEERNGDIRVRIVNAILDDMQIRISGSTVLRHDFIAGSRAWEVAVPGKLVA
jgi:hypothetical protein